MGAEREGIALKSAEGKVGGWLKGLKMRGAEGVHDSRLA
jgi:hypothetical protein